FCRDSKVGVGDAEAVFTMHVCSITHQIAAVVVPVLGSASCGALAGWGGKRLLLRLRRGVRPPPGWCEGVTAVLWAVLALRSVLGAPEVTAMVVPVRPGVPWWWLPVPLVLGWFAVLLGTCDVL